MASVGEKRKRNARERIEFSSSSSDSEEETREKLEALRALQKLRSRQHGVSSASLAWGKKISKSEDVSDADPFKMKTGGFVDMKALKKKPLKGEAVEAIGTAFAAETNRRDEDAEMLKYVEEELARRKGRHKEEELYENKQKSKADSLYELPEHLKKYSSQKRSEDMLSNQMLSGIPEIDLGIDAKIKNIELTEEAKQKLLEERKRQRDNMPSDFVPTNVAVNFVQHNRFNIDDNKPKLVKKIEEPKPEPVRVGDIDKDTVPSETTSKDSKKKNSEEKATDDFHFEKFKKQMRRF
ncbi:telomere length and silencing protein 1 [Biomphalaria glabrata]|uniref:Splicing factor C9orf78 homolog n=2 Tax=Biomphalaria glabrata TaxID=6526 RepID=A0A9W3BDX7_BIOGL|nr:splicing factor C9orf78 homolog [Biomphalaria glabrata]KAI8732332.1 telomere length and silencing protein 1-like protein [Biomphalaria glabrata]KAI8778817.1 telomere length and silencing protein 1 [Biomphalaria glabrata]